MTINNKLWWLSRFLYHIFNKIKWSINDVEGIDLTYWLQTYIINYYFLNDISQPLSVQNYLIEAYKAWNPTYKMKTISLLHAMHEKYGSISRVSLCFDHLSLSI